MKYDEFFRKHSVFTGDELTKFLSLYGKEVGPRTREALLTYYRKTGHVISIKRGLYAVVPSGTDPNSYPVDSFLIAGKLTQDAVLSYHTALEFHGRAYSVGEHFIYSANRPLSRVTFRGQTFRGVKFPQALSRAEKEHFGVVTVDRVGMEVRVTCLERTLVDVLNRPNLCGGWEEIWRSLESIEFFNLDQVVEYTLLLGNATTAAKVGFFLDQHRESLMVEENHLEPLHALSPKQPHYLDRIKRESGRLVSRWNLVVPTDVLNRIWAEVS